MYRDIYIGIYRDIWVYIYIYMAVSHLFRDMIFLRAVRSQMNGLYTEM